MFTSSKNQPTEIVIGKLSDLDELFKIYVDAKNVLEEKGIFQWTIHYPSRTHIEYDLSKKASFVLRNDNEIIGAINISEQQEFEYQTINWQFDDNKVLVIHRLVINPKYQRNGFSKILMDFAENYALKNGYSSIRLDAYSQNEPVLNLYTGRNYFIRGEVNFPGRDFPFLCMEKEIILNDKY